MLPFTVTEDDLTNALFHGTALNATGSGTKAEARQQARLMLTSRRLLDALETVVDAARRDALSRRFDDAMETARQAIDAAR